MLLNKLNSKTLPARQAAVAEAVEAIAKGKLKATPTEEANNHVHSTYSFSPYYPSAIVYKAWEAGLSTVGIMDHDSVAGGHEVLAASKAFGLATTVGFEMRVNFDGTALQGKKFNNPDSNNIVYIAIHGIPSHKIDEAQAFLKPVHAARNLRNRAMVEKLNGVLSRYSLPALNYEKDVYAISQAFEGGSITERHLMCAMANLLIQQWGQGSDLVEALKTKLKLDVSDTLAKHLCDERNPHLVYDLIGLLKSSFLPQVFIQPDHTECGSVFEAVAFAKSIGAIPAYAYLGDVGDSVTGDKLSEKFEDDFLDELFPELVRIGFQSVTYMPPRNSLEQLLRIQKLCKKYGLFEISGVDINSSRQKFNCPILLDKDFKHLITSTWALIAHERLSSRDSIYGIFNPASPLADRSLEERISIYDKIGRSIDYTKPEDALSHFKL
jgi:hypothetical protein